MMQGLRRTFDVAAITTIIMCFAVLGMFLRDLGFFLPRPFRDVQTTNFEILDDDRVLIEARYSKTSARCEFSKLVVFGLILNEPEALTHEPYRGPNVDEQRTPGAQVMRIAVQRKGVNWDSYEMRTRHFCGSEVVNRLFLRVDPSDFLKGEET